MTATDFIPAWKGKKPPEDRGFFLVDKPPGVTSHDVVDWARRVFQTKKIGHAGTLDPLATGLLVLLLGREYTKRQTEFLHADKTYYCEARFGMETDSYDTDGTVLADRPWSEIQHLTDAAIQDAVEDLTGTIEQQVPPYSAVKVDGEKLYELARQGRLDELDTLPSREVTVHEFELVELNRDELQGFLTASFRIRCSSGTYVRSLIHDLGQAVAVGATVTALRREEIDAFDVDDAILCPLI